MTQTTPWARVFELWEKRAAEERRKKQDENIRKLAKRRPLWWQKD